MKTELKQPSIRKKPITETEEKKHNEDIQDVTSRYQDNMTRHLKTQYINTMNAYEEEKVSEMKEKYYNQEDQE